jgi:hypothetical protein
MTGWQESQGRLQVPLIAAAILGHETLQGYHSASCLPYGLFGYAEHAKLLGLVVVALDLFACYWHCFVSNMLTRPETASRFNQTRVLMSYSTYMESQLCRQFTAACSRCHYLLGTSSVLQSWQHPSPKVANNRTPSSISGSVFRAAA